MYPALSCASPARAVVASVLRPIGVVDCWIGVVQEVDRRVVRLAGRLSVDQVPELFKACGEGGPVEVDLTDLVSADVAGIEALQRIRRTGALLVGIPGYIKLKLDSPTGGPSSAPSPSSPQGPGRNG